MMSEKIRDHVVEVENKNIALERVNRFLQKIKDRIEEMGISVDRPMPQWEIRNKLDEIFGALPAGFEFQLRNTISGLQELQKMVGDK